MTAALAALDPALPLTTPSPLVAAGLRRAGRSVAVRAVERLPARETDALVLADDELSRAGEGAEGLLAMSVGAVIPRGALFVSALGAVVGAKGPAPGRGRRFNSEQLLRTLGHASLAVEFMAAPGAAAAVSDADTDADYDPRDRLPGLLDAGARVVALGRTPRSPQERSEHFFASLPRKVVAAAALCRDRQGRLLVVYDSFRRHWTIPGGIVDRDEDPRSGALRETWEESGVRVEIGALLGVFSDVWPDRIVLVYGATPVDGAPSPVPVHAHEISEAAWVDFDAALDRLAPYVRAQVTHCLEQPGRTWPRG